VEGLALSLGVRIVASINLTVTEEGSVWNVGKDWIVAAGLTGDASFQVEKRVTTAGTAEETAAATTAATAEPAASETASVTVLRLVCRSGRSQ